MKQKAIYIFIIIALSVGAFLSMDMYVPSFPSLMEHFSVEAGRIQLSMSLFVMSFALSQLICGICSDQFGRKPVLTVGLSLFTLGSLFTLFAPTISWFNAARILQGLGIGASTSLSRIILNDFFKGKTLAKTLSLISSLIVITTAIAPFLGGFLQDHFNFYGSLTVMLTYGVLLLFIVKYKLPETNKALSPHAIHPRHLKRNIIEKIKTPQFIILSLINGFAFSLVLIYTMITPFIFQQEFHYSAFSFGIILLLMACGIAIGALLNYKLINVFLIKKIVLFGLLLATLSSSILLVSTVTQVNSPTKIILLIVGVNVGVGLVLPNIVSMIFKLFTQETGLVGAIYGFLRMFVAGCLGVIISSLHLTHLWEMTLLMGASNFMGLFFYLKIFNSLKE